MPIFEKDGRRVYFAHIPKSGGVSVYSAFLADGWAIKNVDMSRNPHSAFSLLQERFGVEEIAREGRKYRYPHPLQHAPHLVWRTWGPFDASFAIARDPFSRLLSALRYLHRRRGRGLSFGDFARTLHAEASARPWAHLLKANGHLIPQHYFVSRQTEVFRFEEDWGSAIARRFDIPEPGRDNGSPARTETLPDYWAATARRLYRKDFARFGYADRVALTQTGT